jgi:hypothetical protein
MCVPLISVCDVTASLCVWCNASNQCLYFLIPTDPNSLMAIGNLLGVINWKLNKAVFYLMVHSEYLGLVLIHILYFWFMTSGSLVFLYQRFVGTGYLHLQEKWLLLWWSKLCQQFVPIIPTTGKLVSYLDNIRWTKTVIRRCVAVSIEPTNKNVEMFAKWIWGWKV